MNAFPFALAGALVSAVAVGVAIQLYLVTKTCPNCGHEFKGDPRYE